MIKLLFIFAFLLLSIFYSPLVFAHTLENENSIGAIMHIDPEDSPIAGKNSTILFQFKDKENRFDPKQCDCQFKIIKDNQEIYSQPLYLGNDNPTLENAVVKFNFPEKGVYQLKVSGKPFSNDAFDEFDLSFEAVVSREDNPSPTPTKTDSNDASGQKFTISPTIFLIIGLIVSGLIFGIYKISNK